MKKLFIAFLCLASSLCSAQVGSEVTSSNYKGYTTPFKIYAKTSWSDTRDFVSDIVASPITLSINGSNDLVVTGATGTFTKNVRISGAFCELQNATAIFNFTLGTKTGGTVSWFGTTSTNTYISAGIKCAWLWNTGGSAGKIGVYNNAGTNLYLTTSTLASATGDVCRMTIVINGPTVDMTVDNITQGVSLSIPTFTYDISSIGTPVRNGGNWSFGSFTGSYTINDISITTTDPVNPFALCVGDSKTFGYAASTYANSWPQLVAVTYPSTKTNAGPNDQTRDVLGKMNQIIQQHPQRVILAIGSNDIRNGISSTVYLANYHSIVSQFTSANIRVIHLLLAEGVLSQTTLFNDINSTYSSNDIINAGLTAGDWADNVHPNDTGSTKIATAITTFAHLQ